jgi:hypothetical protein
MAMNVPGAARQVFEDRGEQLDASQILSVGGSISAGQTWNNQLYGQAMAQDSITANAGGGQQTTGPSVIVGPLARVTTVATAADSITLPKAVRGMEVTVVNDAAVNSLNVFPASGDQINALAANAAFADAAGGAPVIFICFSNGFWRTK